MQKSIVLLSAPEGMDNDDFLSMYLNKHARKLLDDSSVLRYVANVIEEPSETLLQAGWGWGGKGDSGIRAVDEVWTKDGNVLECYGKTANIIGAFKANEVVLRPCFPELPLGEKSYWLKRIGLLKCLDGQRPEDFFEHWQFIHGPIALKEHIGAGCYIQHHFTETLKAAPVAWNGSVSLSYWDINAFRYGHFSRPESMAVIKEDGAKFLGVFLAMLASEYVMRR